jgi:hypothetical protein
MEGTTMNQLVGQDVADRTSTFPCVVEREHAEAKRAMEAAKCGSLSRGLLVREVALVCRSMTSSGSGRSDCSISVSPRFNSSLTRSLLRGLCAARRHCVVLLSGLLSQNRSGPLSRMHDLALGSRAHSHGFAQV